MGFWDWIVDKLAVPAGRGRSAERVGVTTAGDGAVATLDPPHDQEAVETNCEASQPAGDRWWEPEGVTLTDPVEPERPDLCAEALALENVLVSHFDGHGLDIPPMPRVPNMVLKRLRDRDCDFRVVAEDIAEDQVIAAAVLRIANSPLYRGLDKITQLPAAVTRLGNKGVRTLMMHVSLHAAVFLSKGG